MSPGPVEEGSKVAQDSIDALKQELREIRELVERIIEMLKELGVGR